MNYNQLGKSALKVSAIGLGSWITGKAGWSNVNDADSIDVIHASIERGVNFIDTAPIYGFGHAESIIGKTIKPFRDKIILATKCGLTDNYLHDLSPKGIIRELELSLKRLNTDYIDLYQAHWPDPTTAIESTMGTFLKLKEKGLIREIGFCNHSVAELQKVIAMGTITSLQHQYSLLNRNIETDIIPFSIQNDIGILAYGALHGGLLTGKYRTLPAVPKKEAKSFFYKLNDPDQWNKAETILHQIDAQAAKNNRSISAEVLNWTLSQKNISSVLLGARNTTQLFNTFNHLF